MKILARFEAQGIFALAFKGPIMAQQLYGQLALREMYDLDLLIHPADAPAAVKLLEAEGFVPQFQLTPARLARYVGLRCELMLWHEDKELPVDLHWNPLPLGFSFTPAPELVWDNPATVRVGERVVRTLSPENLLLYLCAHHAKDNWPRLRTVVDLAALLYRFPEINWDQVRGRAGHFGSVRMLRVGLLLAATLFEPPLPAEISRWMTQDRMAVKLATRILQYLSDDNLPERPPSDAVYRATMDSPRDLAWYWIDRVLLPTPLEWALVDLPDWLYPLYYPIRAGRLLGKHTVAKGKSEIRNPKSENRNQEPKD